MASLVRQNYHADCEAAVNEMINRKLASSYFYMALAFHFDRDDVALKGFHEHFKSMSDSKREYGMMLMKYQNERGGRIKLQNVPKPSKDDWGCGLDAMHVALEEEKQSNTAYIALYTLAEKHGDEQLADFVEDNFLEKQTELIKDIGDKITNLQRTGKGLGEYQFDHHLK